MTEKHPDIIHRIQTDLSFRWNPFVMPIVFFAFLTGGLFWTSRQNYLLFHSLVELFSIVVAFSLFMLVWHSRKYITNEYILFVGMAYVFIGSLDLLHTFSYKGMAIFNGHNDYATQLWIAARFLESISLLAGFFFLSTRRRIDVSLFLIVYALITGFLIACIFFWKIFPICFVDGRGLTPFKKVSEYIICLILLGDIYLLHRNKSSFDDILYRLLTAALVFTVLSELSFSLYLDSYGFSNLVGHFFKLYSFIFIYQSVVKTGIETPGKVIFHELELTNQKLNREITDRKKIEYENKKLIHAFRESQRRLSMAAQAANIGFHEVDLESKTITWDDVSCSIHGYAPYETFSMPLEKYLNEILHPDDVRLQYPLYQKALASGDRQWKGTYRIIRPDGDVRWIDEHHVIIRDAEGKVIRSIGAKIDVSKRKKNDEELARYRIQLEDLVDERTQQLKKIEHQLAQSQKLEAIGQLAGGIAHDLNNLLTVILGFGDSILEELNEKDPLREDLGQIMAAGTRAANLIRQLLAFSRRQPLEPKTVKLNDILTHMEHMLTRLIGENIDFSTALNLDIWTVRLDPGQLEQVIMNLVINARDAMPQGGTINLETSNEVIEAHDIKTSPLIEPGSYVVLTVRDTGTGMEPETITKIFDPFYTTKELGKGTGLGLSTVYGIVKQSGGHICVDSEPGRGTTFKIYFPKIDGVVTTLEKENRRKHRGVGETLLVVEDELSLHLLLERMLKKMGYNFFVTAKAEEAIEMV
ncbi:MAG: PAS domain-containing protein, partial [Proteobacteria bacterium]|nr:PAS domain-containing protein [Pseudomonadota bacterium]